MADQVENLRQADLAKLPFFSGDKTDTFTFLDCSQVVEAEDLQLRGCEFKPPLRRLFFRHH